MRNIIHTPLALNENDYNYTFIPRLTDLVAISEIPIEIVTSEGDDIIDTTGYSREFNTYSRDIRKLGYDDNSLVHIANLAKECEHTESQLKSLEHELNNLKVIENDPVSRHYSKKSIHFIEDLVHSMLLWSTHALHRVKHNCALVAPFYKKS